jgi:hypothetical protein
VVARLLFSWLTMTKLPLALLALSACVASEPSIPETSEEVTSAIEKPNGGFDTDDEAPLFANPAVFDAAAIEADAVEADAMSPEVTTMESMPGVRVRNVLMLWGQMPADPNVTTVRDWSGRLELDRGGMVIRRRIAFEPVTGDRVLPRTDRAIIDFVSHTRPAADGLVLTIVDPAPGTAPLTLTYTPTGGTARVLELRELADGPLVVDVGDGNRIIVSARDRDPCDHGMMRGRWHALNENGGVYVGVVADEDGAPIGHVRGIWGQRQTGERVFFGKFIDRDGHFRGILAGNYGEGHFDGRWITRAGEHGQVHGLYFRHETLRGGGFIARWGEASCRR